MANYYYSGQGKFYFAQRNATTGKPMGFTWAGNASALELSIETTKFEHKESYSGNRAVDVTVIQEKKSTFTATVESLDKDVLAMGFWGTAATVAAGTAVVADDLAVYHDKPVPLAHPKVSNVSVTGSGGTPTYVLNTDYTLNAAHGTITALSTGAITDGGAVDVTYDHAAYDKVDAFTQTSMERYLRFEGLNTLDQKEVTVDMFKANIDPLSGFGLINEELASYELTGSILLDDKVVSGSQFFVQKIVS